MACYFGMVKVHFMRIVRIKYTDHPSSSCSPGKGDVFAIALDYRGFGL